jgi:hypothetical protein
MIYFLPNSNAKKLKLAPLWSGRHVSEVVPATVQNQELVAVITIKSRSDGNYYYAHIDILSLSFTSYEPHYDREMDARGIKLIRQNYSEIQGSIVKNFPAKIIHPLVPYPAYIDYDNGQLDMSVRSITNVAASSWHYTVNAGFDLPGQQLGRISAGEMSPILARINELVLNSVELIHTHIPREKLCPKPRVRQNVQV